MSLPDEQEFRKAVGLMPTGVTVVGAMGAEGPAGATASAVCSLSLDPMMMLLCLDHGSRTLTTVQGANRFSINVLSHAQRPAAEVFASKAEQAEKWASVVWHERSGVPLIRECPALVICELRDLIAAGDHVILTGDVLEVDHDPAGGDPLVYHGGLFRTLDPEPRTDG